MLARTSITWRVAATRHLRPNVPSCGFTRPSRITASSLRSFSAETVSEQIRVPSLADADKQPLRFCELSNETLSVMAVNMVHGAHKERLLREIMRVDRVSWVDANKRYEEINAENDKFMTLVSLPYRVGIFLAIGSGVGSVPMVFHHGTAKWFNETFVHETVPPPAELETIYQVGNWTWGWMEPVLGTASFVLLAMQLVRAQMGKMHLKPYTEFVISKRADRLAAQFPMYNRVVVRDFAKSDPWHT